MINESKLSDSRDLKIYFIKQKILGILMVVIAITIPFILEGDITISLFFLPIGILIISTKELVLTNKYFFDHIEDQERR